MDLHKEWQKLQAEKFEQPQLKKEEIMEAIYKESKSTISTLTRNMLYKAYWTIGLFTVFGAVFLASLGNTELALVSGICVAYFLIGMIGVYSQYRKLAALGDIGGQTLTVLKSYYKRIKNALLFEEVLGMFFYPIAAVCGILFSLIYLGKTIEEVFANQQMLIIMLVCITILTPLGVIAARLMNKKAFGGFINQLKDHIKELERLD